MKLSTIFRSKLFRWAVAQRDRRWRIPRIPHPDKIGIELLEPRFVPSGNVDVFPRGDNVHIRGDSSANNVEISLDSGNIVVAGLEGTTINGSTSAFTLRTASNQIEGFVFVSLGDGDDRLVMKGGIQLNRNLIVASGRGNDDLGFENASVLGTAIVLPGSGNDRVVFRSLSISGNLFLNLGPGDDTLNTQSINVGNNLRGLTGAGADAIVIEQTMVANRLMMRTGNGDDAVSITDSTISDDATLKTGNSADFISIQSTAIGEHLKITSTRGDDSVVLGGSTTLGSWLLNFAGPGADAMQIGPNVTIDNPKKIQSLIESDTVPDSLIAFRLDDPQTGAHSRAAQARVALGFVPAVPLQLTILTSGNATVASHETLLTIDSSFTITGTTTAGAMIAVARDIDQIFDDGTTTADANGNFSIDVTLAHNDANRGSNPIVVRAKDSFSGTATQSVQVHFVVGSVVRMETNLGFIDMELLDADAPTFVTNFKNYFADYTNSIVHRLTRVASDGLSVIQGGGFVVSGSSILPIATDPDIDNDFNPANLNVRGALSMARIGGSVNSATSQWFINTIANATLDAQQFTVFGHVIGSSLPIVDAIAALGDFDLRGLTGVSALNEVPLQNYALFDVPLAGTVATTNGSAMVTGAGTAFTTSIPADKKIRIGSQVFTIGTVNSDTQLTLTTSAPLTQSGVEAQVNAVPNSTQYVRTTSVTTLTV